MRAYVCVAIVRVCLPPGVRARGGDAGVQRRDAHAAAGHAQVSTEYHAVVFYTLDQDTHALREGVC